MPRIIVAYANPELDGNIRALCEDYWRREDELSFKWVLTLNELAEKFGFPPHVVSRIARENSYATDEKVACPACRRPHRCTGRSDYDRQRGLPPHPCEDCVRAAEEAEDARIRAEEASKRDILGELLASVERRSVTVSELSLTTAIQLLAVARATPSEYVDMLGPLANAASPLTPSVPMSMTAIRSLHEAGILTVDVASPVDAFDWSRGNPVKNLDLSRVIWRVALGDRGEALVPTLEDSMRAGSWNPGWQQDVFDLWRAIVFEEALEFLMLSMEDHQLRFSPGEKTSMVLTAALDKYSLARVWGVIWKAAKDGAAFRARGAEPWRAAASVITRIEGYTEHAVAQGWPLKPYRRHWNTTQSMLSRVFFGDLLQLPAYEDERTPPATERDDQSASA